jgi:hypothetical protein
VIVIDPVTGELDWTHPRDPDDDFYSEFCGAAQHLSNGNTLVTESDRGRAFEVTPEGEVVWEFFSPHRAGDRDQWVATLFEVVRLPEDFGRSWRSGPR